MSYFTAELPGTGGMLKVVPEDFIVDEIPAYAASGAGPHWLVHVEKRGVTTQDMVGRLGRALGVAPAEIGVAGQKDRQAVTRQFVSLPAASLSRERVLGVALDGVRVLDAALHRNKLRTGHLRGNRFTVVVRGAHPEGLERARAVVARLAACWVPNRFGLQRFGRYGTNAADGRALVEGRLRISDRFRRKLLISAYQSELFNRYLTRRHEAGLLHRLIEGDILQRTATGGLFVLPAGEGELERAEARFAEREIVATGPMFGSSVMSPPEGTEAARREAELLGEEGLGLTSFAQLGRLAEGTRRPLLVPLGGAEVEAEGENLRLAFSLPPGAYATVVLEEVMKAAVPLAVAEE